MKKGQTSKRGGYEDILFPMEICNITQGDNTGTHKGAYAVDLAGKDTGRDNAYMPFTGVIKAIDSPANGNALFIQSTNKVRFADGTIDYCTVMFVHDNERTGWAVGKTFKQGVQIYTEGTAGKAYGNHIHFEIAKGKFVHMYDLNKYGVYELPNNIPVEKACFMDGTTMKVGKANWKYLKDVKVKDNCPFESSGTVQALYDKIRVRTSPSTKTGDTGLVYNKGMILNYSSVVTGDGWYWAKYKRSNGGTGYCALCKTNGSSKYWKQV